MSHETDGAIGAAPIARRVGRLYPFLSGRARLANTKASEFFLPRDTRIREGQICGRRCFAASNDLIGRTVLLFDEFDGKISWLVDRCVEPGDIVLDVGANIGAVSLRLATRVAPGGFVHAFEPSPVALRLLDQTLSANSELPIILHRIACGESTEVAQMAVPDHNVGAGQIVEAPDDVRGTHEVRMEPLGAYLLAHGIKQVSFMKIDVEDYEPEVFRGLFASATAPRPSVIVYEDRDASASGNIEILLQEKYMIYGVPDQVMFNLRLIPPESPRFLQCTDFVALHLTAGEGMRSRLGLSEAAR